MTIQKGQHIAPQTEFKRGHTTWNKGKRFKKKKFCEQCRKEYYPTNYHAPQKYCSRECYYLHIKSRRIKKACEYCGKGFLVFTFKKHQRFCSKKCFYSYRKIEVKKICESCGKPFYVISSRKNARFCSSKCNYVWRRGKCFKPQVKKVKIICIICGKPFIVKPFRKDAKFCSSGCFHIFEREHPAIWGKGKKSGIEKECLTCGNKFYVYPSQKSKKYCSQSCYPREGECNPAFNNWSSFEPYGPKFNDKLKFQIRKRDNFTCQECNFTEEQLKRKLDVHHIDFDKKNNHPNNLISLCQSCHIQTQFNREDWTNYFQDKLGMRGK